MKTKITTVVILFITLSYAQVSTVFNDSFNTSGLAVDGDYLYIASIFDNNIYKIDWTENNPTAILVADGIFHPGAMAIKDGFLYVSTGYFVGSDDRIVRIDLNQTPAVVEDYLFIVNPDGMAFKGNDLYVYSNRDNISKIDTNLETPIAVEVISNIETFAGIGLTIIENNLYFLLNGQINKYNIDEENPTLEIVASDIYGSGLTSNGNDKLYLNGYIPDFNAPVFELDLNTGIQTVLLSSESVTPWDIVFTNNLLFISNYEGGEVKKIDLNALSINEYNSKSPIIFPNPTNDFITVNNLFENKIGIIYNALGQKIKSVEVVNESKINIQNLTKGIYFLKIEGFKTLKFIKNY